MDILKDIAKLVRDDRDYNIEVKINSLGLTVYLEYDPDRNFEEKCIIPIHYDTLDEYACIPQDELAEKFHPNERGIELSEIILIEKILKYMEENSDCIIKLCSAYDLADRHREDNE